MTVRRIPVGPKALEEAVGAIEEGGLVGVPTDTVYGLACDPKNDEAVVALFEAKRREKKPIPVLCSGIEVAAKYVELGSLGRHLAELHWPGALTIVAPLRKSSGLSGLLDQGSGYLGVRVPDSEFCVALAAKVGGGMTGTSANLSGEPSCRTAVQVVSSLGSSIQLVVDGGELKGRESTVVKLSEGAVEVLREGSVRIQAVRKA